MNAKKVKKLEVLLDKSAKKVDKALNKLEEYRKVYYKIKHKIRIESTEVFFKDLNVIVEFLMVLQLDYVIFLCIENGQG